ncbi:hypothetical protein TWF696_005287 [Orbilia brochopaga]|uniref:Uncharacterized protein n=1 Tax=Orbilia brochopaga TaxID=3140254 RepID=A0AAV9V0C3_9PEZI
MDGLEAKRGRPKRTHPNPSSRVQPWEDVTMAVTPQLRIPGVRQVPPTMVTTAAGRTVQMPFPTLEVMFEYGSGPKDQDGDVLLSQTGPKKRSYTRRIEPIGAVELVINESQIIKAENLPPPRRSPSPLTSTFAHTDSSRFPPTINSLLSAASPVTSPSTIFPTTPIPTYAIPPGLVPVSPVLSHHEPSGPIYLPPPVIPSGLGPCNIPWHHVHGIPQVDYSRAVETSSPILYMWDSSSGFCPSDPYIAPPSYDWPRIPGSPITRYGEY